MSYYTYLSLELRQFIDGVSAAQICLDEAGVPSEGRSLPVTRSQYNLVLEELDIEGKLYGFELRVV